MPPGRARGPACTRLLISTRFDATFRLPDQSERLCFGIPGGLCTDCHQLYIDPDLIQLLDLSTGRCTFAIESDVVPPGLTSPLPRGTGPYRSAIESDAVPQERAWT